MTHFGAENMRIKKKIGKRVQLFVWAEQSHSNKLIYVQKKTKIETSNWSF